MKNYLKTKGFSEKEINYIIHLIDVHDTHLLYSSDVYLSLLENKVRDQHDDLSIKMCKTCDNTRKYKKEWTRIIHMHGKLLFAR